jgi:hypothetical protein
MKPIFAALFVLTASAAMAAVDPVLLDLVMPDAKALAGVQVDQAQSSALGQYLLSQLNTDANLEKLTSATGFDPRHDLHEILAAGVGGAGGMLLVRGNFQPAKIEAAAVQAGAVSSMYNGIDLITFKPAPSGTGTQTKRPGSVAFLDASTAIIGQTADVEAAIDRHASGVLFSGDLAQKAQEVASLNDAWFATLMPPSGLLAGKLQNPNGGNLAAGNPFQAVLQTSGGVKFASTGVTVSADAVTRSDQDAQALMNVLQFLASMVRSNNNQNPDAAKISAILQGATLTTNGPVLHVSLTVPEQQVEELLTAPRRQGPANRARRTARGARANQ